MRTRLLLGLVLLACEGPPARGHDAHQASARAAESAAVRPPAPQSADEKQLERAMHDLVNLVFNVKNRPRDTADAPAWTAKLDAIETEMPDQPSDPKYAAA